MNIMHTTMHRYYRQI